MGPRSVCNIVVNTHWKRIWFLEYHADFFSELIDVQTFIKNINVVILDIAGNPDAGNQVVHAVQGF